MPLTSPDNIYSPARGASDKIEVWSGSLAASVQDALKRRANSYRGTTAERNAFTSEAPTGTLWVDTNSGNIALYIRQGAGWSKVWPEDKTDTGWLNSGFWASSSGWRVRADGVSRLRRVNNWVVGYLEVERTGGTINVPPSGNITNQTLLTLNAPYRPDLSYTSTSAEGGRLAAFMVNPSGGLRLHAVAGTTNIVNGDYFSTRIQMPLKISDLP